jgi:tRNA threonylcarbamoyladenosine biosynthesis protein TsaB
MLLAIDTTTALTGLALADARGPLAECVWESGRNHTAQLLPQLDLLLRHTGIDRQALRAVAIALGPGSWSGLRVGMSIAKGLVLAGNLVLLGVNSLEALAYQHGRPGIPLYPLIRLGRDRFATAPFLPGVADPGRQGPDHNTTPDELCAMVKQPAMLCGDVDERLLAHLGRSGVTGIEVPSPAAALRRPAFLAELAWRRFVAGDRDDPVTIEPIYLGEAVKQAATDAPSTPRA